MSRPVGAEPLFPRPSDGDGFRRTGAMLDRQRLVCGCFVLLYNWLSHARPHIRTAKSTCSIYTYTRAYLGRKALSQLVHGRAVRISDILQSVPLMSREVRGTETRYLAVVGTREHGLGNVCESD